MAFENLSYTNQFNQQKIIANGSQSVSVPGTTLITTVLTVPTNETTTPTARAFIEFNGIMAPLSSGEIGTINTIGKTTAFFAYFNALNGFVVQVASSDSYTCTIYYRIYKDGRPT